MAKLASRIFNDTLSMDENVKKRLEEIQDLSGGVFDSVSATDAQLNKNKHTFGGAGYLSGKTPFARLWTAVKVTKKTDASIGIPVDENISNYPFDFENNEYEFPELVQPGEYGGTEITETPLEKYPENNYKVYQLGMNPSVERNIFSPQQDDTGTTKIGKQIIPSQKNNYTDQSYTGNRKNLRPPAGITNIVSTTQNSLGPVAGILKTTIEFSVYDFEEFDLIYSKYFLRPAAKVFVDFGWTDDKTFQLYNPEDYLLDPKTFNEKIYGKIETTTSEDGTTTKKVIEGQIQQSKYGIEFIQGQVTNFSSDLDTTTGAYKCRIDVSSKNMQIFDVNLEDDIIGNIKKNILSNIEFRVLEVAENALFPNKSNLLNPDAVLYGTSADDEEKEWGATSDIFAAEILSSKTNNIPTKLNTELGVFWKGTFTTDKKDESKKVPQTGEDAIYLSYGFIEDVLLNSEMGKYSKASEQFNDTEDAIEFDSSQSYTTWSEILFNRQKFLKTNTKLPFLFPEEWEDTYNTRIGKSPADAKTSLDDKTRNRIPIREIFIKLSVFKTALKSAETITEVFNFIFKKMADSTGYVWDWSLNSTTANGNGLGIIDRNYNTKEIVNNNSIKSEINGEDFFNNMFQFEPFSPKTIVKGMNLNLSLGDGSAISSKLALQSLGKAGRNIFPTSEIIDQTQITMAIEDLQDDGTYKSIYNVEYYPPSQGGSDLEKIFAAFESDADPSVSDPTLLSSENIYGGSDSKFSIIPANTKTYINKAEKILIEKGEAGDKEPSSRPTVEYKKFKAVLENSNYEFCDNAYEYFTKKHLTFAIRNKPTILPQKLALTLHGFTGLQPSDKFRVNNIPSRYSKFVFFQVMRITHNISSGVFNTDLECVMRIRDDVKQQLPINTKKVNVLIPSILKNGHKLSEITKILPFIAFIEPNLSIMDVANSKNKDDDKQNNISYVYTITTLPTANGATNYLKGAIDTSYQDAFEDADNFMSALQPIIDKVPNIQLKEVRDLAEDAKTATYKIRYVFRKSTKYLLYICGKKFLITDKSTALGTADTAEYFSLINGQYEQPEKPNEGDE